MATGSPPASERWLIRIRERATIGPFPADFIALGIARGKVPPESEVCREGSALWRPLATVPAFVRAVASSRAPAPDPTDDEEGAQLGAHSDTLPDAEDDDEATRVLDALRSDPPEAPTAREPFLPPRAPLTRAAPPGRLPADEAAVPTPRVRPGRAQSPYPGTATDDETTAILGLPPPLLAPLAPAASAAAPAASPPAGPSPARTPSVADELFDADDDDDDGGVHRLSAATLESVRPAAGAPPPTTVRPAAGAPPVPALRREPPAAERRPTRHRVDRADELTAPAQRLRVAQDRLTRAVVLLAGGLVATLLLLVVLLLVLLFRG